MSDCETCGDCGGCPASPGVGAGTDTGTENNQPRRGWTDEQKDRAIELWGLVMTGLVRAYDGDRLKMWERVPNACVSAARQSVRLPHWLTMVMRFLQIPQSLQHLPNSASNLLAAMRLEIRAWSATPDQAERRALRQLTDETAAITAEAMQLWDAAKRKK